MDRTGEWNRRISKSHGTADYVIFFSKNLFYLFRTLSCKYVSTKYERQIWHKKMNVHVGTYICSVHKQEHNILEYCKINCYSAHAIKSPPHTHTNMKSYKTVAGNPLPGTGSLPMGDILSLQHSYITYTSACTCILYIL
jgi:hypothetical protein